MCDIHTYNVELSPFLCATNLFIIQVDNSLIGRAQDRLWLGGCCHELKVDGSIPGLGRGENFTYEPNSKIREPVHS